MVQAPTLLQQLDRARSRFRRRFGRAPAFAAVGPGRVNLIGEHTDYNDGFVLPMAIERQTLFVADRRQDSQACVVSTGFDGDAVFRVDPAIGPGRPAWANYVRGVVAGCLARGLAPGGFDAVVDSTVPVGAGLSSSAALEVATATLVEALSGRSLDPVDKARLCQEAEHEFAGVPCGIMDQLISSLGREGAALLIDCRGLETRLVSLSDPAVVVLIVDSNVKHEHAGGQYAQRRAQCEAAAQSLGRRTLRDAQIQMLNDRRSTLDPLLFRRAYHVIGENERTCRGADLLARSDWSGFGRLMYDSHAALRDSFEVSCHELDTLVALAAQIGMEGGVFGARMTGGGFGGCIVSLVRADAVEPVAAELARRYQQATGITATAFASRAAAGARVLKL